MEPRRFSAPVSGGDLVGWRSGQGPPALILHGGPGMNDYTEGLAAELDPVFDCIRYQQRGVPPSVVGGDKRVEGHVGDALGVLAALSIEEAVLIGHSWGGYLAMEIAARHPDRVSGLVWINGIGATRDGGWEEFDAELYRRLPPEVAERAKALDALSEAGEGTDETSAEMMALVWPAYFADIDRAPPFPEMSVDADGFMIAYNSVMERLQRGDLGSELRSFEGPSLFIQGEKDPAPRWSLEETVSLFPRAMVRKIPECGHFPWWESPLAIQNIVGEWLEGQER